MEDKELITKELSICLKSCRAGQHLHTLDYDKNREIVMAVFDDGCKIPINVDCDSGAALIIDVVKALM